MWNHQNPYTLNQDCRTINWYNHFGKLKVSSCKVWTNLEYSINSILLQGLHLAGMYVCMYIDQNTCTRIFKGFPGGSVVKNPPALEGDTGSTLIWEDPTCRRTTKPVCHNYWACALEPRSRDCWAHIPWLLKPEHPRAHAPQQERPPQAEVCAS